MWVRELTDVKGFKSSQMQFVSKQNSGLQLHAKA